MSSRRVRVAVCSVHAIVRTGVEQLLQEVPARVEVVGQSAADGRLQDGSATDLENQSDRERRWVATST